MTSVQMDAMNDSSPQLMDDDDITSAPYPLDERSRPRKRVLFACAVVCCIAVVFCAGLISTVITLSVLLSHENHETNSSNCSACPSCPETSVCGETHGPNYFGPLICNTSEYQIKLEPRDWSDREAAVKQWMDVVKSSNKYYIADEAHEKTSCRHQWDLHLEKCGVSEQIRSRSYYAGDEVGTFYTDTKANTKDMSVCAQPFAPASKYLLNTYQKCEHDLHECTGDDKYSRETRISFQDYEPPMETCGQCAELFPDVFSKMHSSVVDEPTPQRAHSWWWVREYEGYFDADTRYLIAFTVAYSEQEDTINPIHYPYYGEWSIRLFSLGDGLVDEWNQEVVAETETMYHILQEHFSVEDSC